MLKAIEPIQMTFDEKVNTFHQICHIIPQLHTRNIIHGDIKLANMVLDGSTLKLIDFGTSAWMSEIFYPDAISIRSSSPYRLNSTSGPPRRLILEEDIYASGMAVWELFVGETPFGPYISDDEDFELWDRIADGLKVDVSRIEHDEARLYVKKCLSIECLQK